MLYFELEATWPILIFVRAGMGKSLMKYSAKRVNDDQSNFQERYYENPGKKNRPGKAVVE